MYIIHIDQNHFSPAHDGLVAPVAPAHDEFFAPKRPALSSVIAPEAPDHSGIVAPKKNRRSNRSNKRVRYKR